MKIAEFIERIMPRRKEVSGGSLIQAVRTALSGETPRMTMENIDSYLGKYADQAWVFSCINIIQSKGAGVPLRVYRKVGDQQEEIADHPLKILIDSANPMMSGYDLLEATHGFIELAGNSYWLLDRIVNGFPTEIYPLSPKHISIVTDEKKGVVGYEYRINGKLAGTFDPEIVLHFKSWNPLDPFYGQPRLSAGRSSSEMMKNADDYNNAFFKNGAAPGGFLTTELPMEEDAIKRTLMAWKKNHQGPRKAGSVALLEGGLKWQNNASTQSEMMFPELKGMSREDVLTCFNMPPIMVGVFDQANYANAREQRRIFWVDCMIPRLRKIESVINERLAKMYGKDIFVMHDISGIEDIAEDEYKRAQSNSINVSAGIMTINEVRKKLKLEPVEWGDTWYAPFGTSPVVLPGEEIPAPGQPTGAQNPEDLNANEDVPTAPAKSFKSDDALAAASSEPLPDFDLIRRDATWARYKDATDNFEKKWAGPIRALFNSQEKEVIDNLRQSDWQKTLNQNRLDNMKSAKASVSAILFDGKNARRVFQRDSRKLYEYTVQSSAEREINDYDLGISFDLTDKNVQAWISTKAFKFADEVNLTTEELLRRELNDAISNGEAISSVEDRIAKVFDIARGPRTAMIARTEVISAANEGAFASYKQSGVVESKEWISSRDNRVRDTHQIDGEKAGIDIAFSNGLQFPGDPAGDAGDVINCRCTISPIVSKGE